MEVAAYHSHESCGSKAVDGLYKLLVKTLTRLKVVDFVAQQVDICLRHGSGSGLGAFPVENSWP